MTSCLLGFQKLTKLGPLGEDKNFKIQKSSKIRVMSHVCTWKEKTSNKGNDGLKLKLFRWPNPPPVLKADQQWAVLADHTNKLIKIKDYWIKIRLWNKWRWKQITQIGSKNKFESELAFSTQLVEQGCIILTLNCSKLTYVWIYVYVTSSVRSSFLLNSRPNYRAISLITLRRRSE